MAAIACFSPHEDDFGQRVCLAGKPVRRGYSSVSATIAANKFAG
jgi:hypothetical protein